MTAWMITQKSDSIYIKLKQVKTEKNILREYKHTRRCYKCTGMLSTNGRSTNPAPGRAGRRWEEWEEE